MTGTSVAALVASYDTALKKLLQSVTGDPAALRAAAGRCDRWRQSLANYQQSVDNQARQLGSDWSGDAYNAYARAVEQNGEQAESAASKLGYAAGRLGGQATALEDASRFQSAINEYFDANARMYMSLAQASGADQDAIAARVHQVGEDALHRSELNKSQLGRRLAGPESEGLTLFDRSRTYSTGVNGMIGDLAYGADAQARIGPHVTGNLEGGYQFGEDGQPGSKFLAGKFDASLLDGQATAFASDGRTDYQLDGKLKVGADGKLVIGGKDGLSAEADIGGKASLAYTQTDHLGALDLTSKTEASAQAGLHAQLGKGDDGTYGASANLGATAGVTQTESASVGGLKLAVSGGVTTGVGGEAGISGGYDHGHLKFDLNAGATLGEGLKGGVSVDIDVPKVAGEIGDGASYVWHGAQNAASTVSDAVGDALKNIANPW